MSPNTICITAPTCCRGLIGLARLSRSGTGNLRCAAPSTCVTCNLQGTEVPLAKQARLQVPVRPVGALHHHPHLSWAASLFATNTSDSALWIRSSTPEWACDTTFVETSCGILPLGESRSDTRPLGQEVDLTAEAAIQLDSNAQVLRVNLLKHAGVQGGSALRFVDGCAWRQPRRSCPDPRWI